MIDEVNSEAERLPTLDTNLHWRVTE